ncbi:MAG: response regulator [Victivallales bacterium]
MSNVLIVDDDSGVRTLISTIIRHKGGFNVTEAASVAEAEAFCTANKYDLVFLDHHLHDGIGWDIAKMISLDPQKYGNPRIIAMSGSVIINNNDDSRKYYSQFMSKPFDLSELNSIIDGAQA